MLRDHAFGRSMRIAHTFQTPHRPHESLHRLHGGHWAFEFQEDRDFDVGAATGHGVAARQVFEHRGTAGPPTESLGEQVCNVGVITDDLFAAPIRAGFDCKY